MINHVPSNQSVETTACEFAPDIAALIATTNFGENQIGIIPDSIREYDGDQTALFRSESQDIRAIGSGQGVDIELLAPAGAKRAVQTERADTVILPIVIGLSTQLIANVLTPYVEGLLEKWKKSESRRPDVVYRKGAWKPDGTVERVDITGDAESILKILKEESELDDE